MERFPQEDSALMMKNIENELTHGGELAKQLLLNFQSSNSSQAQQEALVWLLNEILNTYDRALSVIEHAGGTGGDQMVAIMSASPGNQEDQPRWISGEKGVPTWTRRVVVCGETGNETQLHDDGHSWRKYGQKDIQRSKYPRCTHGKGCLARKQVQRSNEDPTAYEVTYKGLHTCSNNPPIPIIQPQNELKTPLSHENRINQSQQEPYLNIQTSLKIIDSRKDKQHNIPSSSNFNPENNPIFSDDQVLWEDCLPDFMFPTAPELNYFNDFDGLINNSQGIGFATTKPPSQYTDSSFDSSSGQLGSSFGFGNSSYFP
ncbi:probable WRKY transcription factor 30 isoform X2 [Henckelia pumila]|uniref:probable WRKY transcription factor 30 isoform X2 n=1 Tax=Henckelia pumila TaxID=405737 RepID=UPI003C6E1033